MAWYFDKGAATYLEWSSLDALVAGVSNGPGTIAFLMQDDGFNGATYRALGYFLQGSTSEAGISISSGDLFVHDATGSFADVFTTGPGIGGGDPWVVAISFQTGTNGCRWYAFNPLAGEYTETFTGAPSIPNANASIIQLGTWEGSDFFSGWLGVFGAWEGAMSLAQMQALKANWRTSDWWNNSFGQPECLVEMNVDPSVWSDLAGNLNGFNNSGVIEDTGVDFDTWNFDATGGGGGLTITGAGNVASAQAIGSHTVTRGAVTVSPGAVASSEAIGAHTVSGGAATVSPSGVASGEAVGAHTVTPGAVSVAPGGVASGEAIGTAQLNLGLSGAGGVASGEAIGSPTITVGAVTVAPAGVASGFASGQHTVSGGDAPAASPRQLPTLGAG